MLVQFRVENHGSLRDEHVLSLVAGSDRPGALRVPGLDEALLPAAAIYGANASGKSNVLAALAFMQSAVIDSQRRWEVEGTPQQPFLLSGKAEEPSLYEVDLVVAGVRYRYGFRLSSVRVDEEWLYAWPHGRQATWFHREVDTFTFGKSLHGENEAIRALTRPNSLFLSAAAQNNHAMLLPIFRYFAAWRFSLVRLPGLLGLESPLSPLAERLAVQVQGDDRDAIMQLLREADTGIIDVRVETSKDRVFVLNVGSDQPVEQVRHAVSFRHRTTDQERGWLPLWLESAGTLALLGLSTRVIDSLRGGGVLCIDELEASLHPALAMRVVRMFNDQQLNIGGAQLIFATHDTNLLGSAVDEPALHRDQVWFTEKDETGATHLYPLTDFHPRREENLERGYLQGRYGAVPFLGELIDRTREGDVEDGSGDESVGDRDAPE